MKRAGSLPCHTAPARRGWPPVWIWPPEPIPRRRSESPPRKVHKSGPERHYRTGSSVELCKLCRRRPRLFDRQTREVYPYCSGECASRAEELRNPALYPSEVPNARPRRTSVQASSSDLCQVCHRRPRFHDASGHEYSYCGRECAEIADRRHASTSNATPSGFHPSGAPIDPGPCEVCKRRPKYVEANGHIHPYCGRTCASRRKQDIPQQQLSHQQQQALQAQPSTPQSPIQHTVYFYHRHDPHYGFTNFSDHPVEYHGRLYPTSEHLFQAFKFMKYRPDIAERVRTASGPRGAFDTAHQFQQDVRPDWFQVNIEKMDKVLALKFGQHEELKNDLLDTGDAELVEASLHDAFWGYGADKKGKNELGKALMRLRKDLRGQ